jgi:hypothetical protein
MMHGQKKNIKRTKIIGAFEPNGWRIKRFRNPELSDVDGALLDWFKQQRSDCLVERFCTRVTNCSS